ncbi:MAG TPA: HIT domain-containing protein [Dehalococcoidales bacterium]|nr:HIT domain-containing protein [Dehalococcoidales bacterium]
MVGQSDYMEGCPTCENWRKEHSNAILENSLARATFADSYREGHCVVTVKRHMISASSLNLDEHVAVFDLITKVSRALEKKYSARKTYLLVIGDGDKFQHLHFHLIPKHRNLPSMGVYCFQKLFEVEPNRTTLEAEKTRVAAELKGMIENP